MAGVDRNLVAGTIGLSINGERQYAKGTFTVNPGFPVRETVIGADRPHGYKETPQAASLEGAITDNAALDSEALRRLTNATVTLDLANGKTWLFQDAWYAGEGAMTTDEGEIAFRIESREVAKEI